MIGPAARSLAYANFVGLLSRRCLPGLSDVCGRPRPATTHERAVTNRLAAEALARLEEKWISSPVRTSTEAQSELISTMLETNTPRHDGINSCVTSTTCRSR